MLVDGGASLLMVRMLDNRILLLVCPNVITAPKKCPYFPNFYTWATDPKTAYTIPLSAPLFLSLECTSFGEAAKMVSKCAIYICCCRVLFLAS